MTADGRVLRWSAALGAARAGGRARADAAMDAKIEALAPDLEAYIAHGMKDFDLPGLAIGIVTGDRLVYAKGFGVAPQGRRAGRHRDGLPDRLDHQGLPRHHPGDRRRPGEARLGRPRGRPRPGLPAQGPLGDAASSASST